jgi:hypothetical protein
VKDTTHWLVTIILAILGIVQEWLRQSKEEKGCITLEELEAILKLVQE